MPGMWDGGFTRDAGMTVCFYRTIRRLFGAASAATFLLLVLSIASIWAHFEIHRGSWLFELRDGRYALYQPPAPHEWMGEVLIPTVDSRDAAIGLRCLLICLMLGYALARRFHEVRLNETHRCRECGYNLTANTSGVCPECGTKSTRLKPKMDRDGGARRNSPDADAGPSDKSEIIT